MSEPTVATVMTRTVFTAVADTPFQELVATLTDRGLALLPVIDATGRPIGVVSDVDLLAKLEYHCGADTIPVLSGRRTRLRWHKAVACTAQRLMTTPAPVIGADTPVSTAAGHLGGPDPRGLCAIDTTGRLVGVLTRRDLLRVYLRGDHALKTTSKPGSPPPSPTTTRSGWTSPPGADLGERLAFCAARPAPAGLAGSK